MNGLDWPTVPVMVELLEVPDVERFIAGLEQIRDYQKQSEGT